MRRSHSAFRQASLRPGRQRARETTLLCDGVRTLKDLDGTEYRVRHATFRANWRMREKPNGRAGPFQQERREDFGGLTRAGLQKGSGRRETVSGLVLNANCLPKLPSRIVSVLALSSHKSSVRSVSLIPVFVVLLAVAARAATFTVDRFDDTASATACKDAVPDDCSLRGAIIAANATPGADTIVLPAGTYALVVKGVAEDMAATGDLDISDDLTLQGAGSATTIIDGAPLGDMNNTPDRIFHGDPMGTGTLQGANSRVTLQSAATAIYPTVSSVGAALLNGDTRTPGSPVGSTVMLSDVIVTGNFSPAGGGGIGNYGAMTILNSLITNNSTGNVGGGIGQ